MKKKTFSFVSNFFQKNKHSKKFWLFFIFNLFLYLVAFPFGIFISFLWWFFKSSKVSKKARKIVSYSFLAFVFSISSYTVWVYSKDPEPTLEVQGIENNRVIQSSNIDLSGVFTPSDFTVYINGEKIDSSDGSFGYSYPLQVGENKIVVKVSNFKSTQEEITIIRELSPEEIAQQEAERQKLEEEKKLAEEIKKQKEKERFEEEQRLVEEKKRQEAEAAKLAEETAQQEAENKRIEEEEERVEEARKQEIQDERALLDTRRGNNLQSAKTAQALVDITEAVSPGYYFDAYISIDASEENNEKYDLGGDETEYRNSVDWVVLSIVLDSEIWNTYSEDSKKDLVASWIKIMQNQYIKGNGMITVSNSSRKVAEGNWLAKEYGKEPDIELK